MSGKKKSKFAYTQTLIGGNSDVGSKTGGFKHPYGEFKPPLKNNDIATI